MVEGRCCSHCRQPMGPPMVEKDYAGQGLQSFCCYGCAVIYECLNGLHARPRDLAARNRERRSPFGRLRLRR